MAFVAIQNVDNKQRLDVNVILGIHLKSDSEHSKNANDEMHVIATAT